MREKELRLALVCYGGISLAVYMHGITKEVWRLIRASRAYHAGEEPDGGSEAVYAALLGAIAETCDLRLRVLVDIVTGASAGGINGIFLAHAIATGRSIEPLTDLWLDRADVDVLTDPDARPFSRATKFWAMPLVWAAAGRGHSVDETVDPQAREEVRAKLSRFLRARWFEPPFGGAGFTRLLLDAFDAMAALPPEQPLLPPGQPLDLIVTVTDFTGHPERLRLHSPPEVSETEHRLTLCFAERGHAGGEPGDALGDIPDLVFAARATASFPGAFPPFTVAELDGVLAERGREWPGRAAFLARSLPRHAAVGAAERAVLIDGSVLANAPFRPAIAALRDRPARREVDRRFVFIDPKPNRRSIRLGGDAGAEAPGFFATILGAISEIPREQPIRDNLEAIEARSARIRRMAAIVEVIRPEVEAEIERLFGMTFFLDSPTPARLAAWRAKAQAGAARQAGFAFAGYGHLKVSAILDEIAELLAALGGEETARLEPIRDALWAEARARGLAEPGACTAGGASDAALLFFRQHDLAFRTRRLRALVRRIAELEQRLPERDTAVEAMRAAAFAALAPYLDRRIRTFYGAALRKAARRARTDPGPALDLLAEARDLRAVDDRADALLADAFAALPRTERRTLLLAYLGFPFEDIATLPLLQSSGDDEFNPVNVDRIAPDDATAIRVGGAEATLKGIQFNSFGAFFSRAYRENDYLWGRLHGADRLIDILVSTLDRGALAPGVVAQAKRDAFRAILAEEKPRLGAVPGLIEALEREVG